MTAQKKLHVMALRGRVSCIYKVAYNKYRF